MSLEAWVFLVLGPKQEEQQPKKIPELPKAFFYLFCLFILFTYLWFLICFLKQGFIS